MLEGGVCNMNRPAACVSAVIGHVSCCLHDPACQCLAAWHIPTIKGQLDAIVRHLLRLNAWLVDWHCHLTDRQHSFQLPPIPELWHLLDVMMPAGVIMALCRRAGELVTAIGHAQPQPNIEARDGCQTHYACLTKSWAMVFYQVVEMCPFLQYCHQSEGQPSSLCDCRMQCNQQYP